MDGWVDGGFQGAMSTSYDSIKQIKLRNDFP